MTIRSLGRRVDSVPGRRRRVIDKGTCSRLLDCIDSLGAIEEWRATLPNPSRYNLPNAVFRG